MASETNGWTTRRRFLRRVLPTVLAAGGMPCLQGCSQQEFKKLLTSLAGHFYGLAQEINNYRKQQGLGEIPISPKLTMVAWMHVLDFVHNGPDIEKACGQDPLHSWSSKGYGGTKWTGGCAPPNWSISWDKPKEIAGYPDSGYEISAWASQMSAAQALSQWKGSAPHNAVILNQGQWATPWKALGAVYGGGYAFAWFGRTPDS